MIDSMYVFAKYFLATCLAICLVARTEVGDSSSLHHHTASNIHDKDQRLFALNVRTAHPIPTTAPSMIRHFLLLLLLPVMTSWGFAPLISVGNENYAHLIISPTMQMQASNQEEEEEGLMISITPPCSHEFEVTFPTFHELMLNFQLLLYPRGGGHLSKSKKKPLEKSSFGMFGKESDENKVGLYLQYLNEPDDDDDDTSMMVDVTFSLQLIGNQASGPKFNVEWSAGMRFCGFEKSNLSQGMANDFGTHVMQTQRLAEFLGIPSRRMRMQG